MQRTRIIEELTSEHRVIEKAAAGMGSMADRLSAGGDVSIPVLTRLIEFLRVFADECHHGKEEASLFPVLEAQGVPATGCPLGGLLGEHRKGRVLVTELSKSVEAYESDGNAGRERIAANLRALQELYASHIWKEDNLVFPLADRMVPTAEADRLAVEFRRVESDIGEQRITELTEFAAQLENAAGGD